MRRRRRATDPPAEPVELNSPSIDALLGVVIKLEASDLHITSGIAPTVRVDGELIRIPNAPILNPQMCEYLVSCRLARCATPKPSRQP